MKQVGQIHYRYLTDADFFNLNKPTGSEDGGGGQSYVDFPIKKIPVEKWNHFFDRVGGLVVDTVTHGKSWEFPIKSIGLHLLTSEQRVKIYQRRSASISVSAQTLNRRGSNRIMAWRPEYGFPQPANPTESSGQLPSGLCVYLLRTTEGEVWAGWFEQGSQHLGADDDARELLASMVAPSNTAGATGFIEIPAGKRLLLSEKNLQTPFAASPATEESAVAVTEISKPTATSISKTPQFEQRDEDEIIQSLFGEDRATASKPATRDRVQKILARNSKAVKDLKALYRNRCQISGERFAFKKRNGEVYSEVHHLIPLGEGGADDPRNMIVVNPLVHRMLHYAEVTGLDFHLIQVDEAGDSTLEIRINGEPYTITWHKDHAKHVLKAGTP